MGSSHLPYRPNVGIALFNHENKVFVGERIDTPDAWQMPQGGIDDGEDIISAAMRELYEEVGTDKAEILRIAERPLFYDFPPDLPSVRHLASRYRGQEQTWVALRFTGDDSDIRLDAHDSPEFSRWRWVNLAETVNLIVPFKRDTYRSVVGLFSDFL